MRLFVPSIGSTIHVMDSPLLNKSLTLDISSEMKIEFGKFDFNFFIKKS